MNYLANAYIPNALFTSIEEYRGLDENYGIRVSDTEN